jgi:hypothetical protein
MSDEKWEYNGEVHTIEKSWISPTGALMITLFNPEKKTRVNFNLGNFTALLNYKVKSVS